MAERGSRQGQCSRVCALLLLLLLAGVALFISPATPILLATLVLISPYIFVHFSSKRQSLFIIWGQTPLPAAAPPFPPACQAITLPLCSSLPPSPPFSLCHCVLVSSRRCCQSDSLWRLSLMLPYSASAAIPLLLLLLHTRSSRSSAPAPTAPLLLPANCASNAAATDS